MLETPPKTMAHMRIVHDSQTAPSVEYMLDDTKPKPDDVTTFKVKYQHHIAWHIRILQAIRILGSG